MASESYPFGMGDIRLLYSEKSAEAQPILLGTRSLDLTNPVHLFANSDVVKARLEIEIAESRCANDRVHPTSLELRAVVSSITFFECVAADHGGRHGATKVIEHDNWHRVFWTFLRLFESGDGFLARWDGRYAYMKEQWVNEPRYSVGDLCVTTLTDECGKSYSLPTGETLLEYVDKL